MKTIQLILISIAFLFNTVILASQPNGTSIMQQVYKKNDFYKNKISNVTMVITDENNNTLQRVFDLKTKINGDITKSIIIFNTPVNVKNTALLTHKNNIQNETKQWIYFPAIKSIKTIQNDSQNQSFMGSDFNYSDIAGRRLNQDNHTLVNQDENNYYIQSTPKDETDIYTLLKIKIDKPTLTVLQIEFFNEESGNKPFKTLVNDNFVNLGNSIFEPLKSVMTNHLLGSSTTITRSFIKTNVTISNAEVSIQALRLL